MEGIGKLTTMLFVLVSAMFLGGFVIMNLYNWFLPKIYGLEQITIYQAMAISLLKVYLMPSKSREKNKDEEPISELMKGLGFSILLALFVLSIGFVLKGLV